MGGTPINHQFEWVFSVVNQPAIGDPIYGTPQPCIPWVNRQPRHVLWPFRVGPGSGAPAGLVPNIAGEWMLISPKKNV